DKLVAARRRLEAAWKTRSRDLTPSSPGTDLFGALLVAGQIFQEAGPGRRAVLVIFSDMRQEAGELNFGRIKELCYPDLIEKVRARRLLASLEDTQVYALGVEAAPNSKVAWDCARQFWNRYFTESGAAIRAYSVLRD